MPWNLCTLITHKIKFHIIKRKYNSYVISYAYCDDCKTKFFYCSWLSRLAAIQDKVLIHMCPLIRMYVIGICSEMLHDTWQFLSDAFSDAFSIGVYHVTLAVVPPTRQTRTRDEGGGRVRESARARSRDTRAYTCAHGHTFGSRLDEARH